MHIQSSSILIILAYSESETYSEPWYIQTFGTLRTRDIFRNLGYSEPGIFRTGGIRRTLSNICRGAQFLQYQLSMSSSTWNKYVQKPFFFVKTYGSWGQETGDREFWYNSSKFYCDITSYFWLSTFSDLSATSSTHNRINSFGTFCTNETPLKRRTRLRPLKWNKNWNVMLERKICI